MKQQQLQQQQQSLSLSLVRVNDYIYSKQDFDSSPIVLEDYNLVFFPVAEVGDEIWRCLFRRMMGYSDWNNISRQFDGLRYLSDYTNITQANTIMTSPNYTRAIFIREPFERNLAVFLKHVMVMDKEYNNNDTHYPNQEKNNNNNNNIFLRSCCSYYPSGSSCMEKATKSYEGFLDKISWYCDRSYWRPQGHRMEPKYFPFLNFVGHYESMNQDAKRLLERIGTSSSSSISLWEEYGRTGWGTITTATTTTTNKKKNNKTMDEDDDDEDSIFYNVERINSTLKEKYFTERILEKLKTFHKMDYEIEMFNFTTY